MSAILGKLRQLVESRATVFNGGGDVSYRIGPTGAAGFVVDGDDVSESRLLGYAPAAQAIQLIAGDLAKIPIIVERLVGPGPTDWEPDTDQDVAALLDLFDGVPDGETTAFDMLFQWYFSCLLFGAGYLWIDRQGVRPVGLYHLLPDRTKPIRDARGRQFIVSEINRKLEYFPAADVLYLPMLSIDGLQPCRPVETFRQAFKVAIANQDFTAQYFTEGTHAGGIVMAPPGASQPAVDQVEENLRNRAKKSNWFKSLVLRDGYRWQTTTSNLKDATSVELDEANARHVARFYNLPPSKLGLKGAYSYTLEDENQQYLDSTLSTYLRQALGQFNAKLKRPSDRFKRRINFQIGALDWANAKTRINSVERLVGRNVIDVEEGRKWLQLPKRKS